MDRKKYFVYLHRRASDGLPFYVGKGHGYRDRATINRSLWWKNVVAKHGYIIEILHKNLDEDTSKLLEVADINNKRARGFPMVNISNGGDGNHGWVPSPEVREKISIANSGRSPSQETRAKMSAAQIGRKHTDDTKSKIAAANNKRTPEFNKANGIKRRDKECHGFFNVNIGFFEVIPQRELIEKYDLNAGKVNEILGGTRKEHKGWIHASACKCTRRMK